MEEVLDTYELPVDPEIPLVVMDEASKQVISDLYAPLPLKPGTPRREDHHYVRQGTQSLFLFAAPHLGWRRVSSRDTRTRMDWAEEVCHLLEVDFPQARKVRLVCDNLNTHCKASLYARYDAEKAHRLAQRLEIIFTPRNGSWLNIAEMELSVLQRECLSRRFDNVEQMIQEIIAWLQRRNEAKVKTQWHFRTNDARIKLKGLYPVFDIVPD
jgi:hypothetical protein